MFNIKTKPLIKWCDVVKRKKKRNSLSHQSFQFAWFGRKKKLTQEIRFIKLIVAKSSELDSSSIVNVFNMGIGITWPLTSTRNLQLCHFKRCTYQKWSKWITNESFYFSKINLVMELLKTNIIPKILGRSDLKILNTRSQLVFHSLSKRRTQVQFVQCQFFIINVYCSSKAPLIYDRKLNWIGLDLKSLNDDCCWWHSLLQYLKLQNAIQWFSMNAMKSIDRI